MGRITGFVPRRDASAVPTTRVRKGALLAVLLVAPP